LGGLEVKDSSDGAGDTVDEIKLSLPAELYTTDKEFNEALMSYARGDLHTFNALQKSRVEDLLTLLSERNRTKQNG
jgi:hypothetical protein